jgi:hypothetical protein
MKKILLLLIAFCLSVNLPGQLKITVDSIINASCVSGSNGAIYITVSGGTEPYTFNWERPPINWHTEDITNLPFGQYTLEVIDYEGIKTFFDTIVLYGEDISISIDKSIFGDYNVSCNGCKDGWIEVTGGIGHGDWKGWNYLWTDEKGFYKNGIKIENLSAGIYHLEVQDTNCCCFSRNFELTQPDVPVYSDSVTVWDTVSVIIYDTLTVYDTVYRFTEVKEELTFIDPLAEQSLTIYNYGEYLLTSEIFSRVTIYNVLGAKVASVELTNKIPVAALDSGPYIFIFQMDSGAIFKRKIYIE